MTKQNRLVMSYTMGDKLFARCLKKIEKLGVTHSKLVRDALAIAFAYEARTLKPLTPPDGVACFNPKRRTR